MFVGNTWPLRRCTVTFAFTNSIIISSIYFCANIRSNWVGKCDKFCTFQVHLISIYQRQMHSFCHLAQYLHSFFIETKLWPLNLIFKSELEPIHFVMSYIYIHYSILIMLKMYVCAHKPNVQDDNYMVTRILRQIKLQT